MMKARRLSATALVPPCLFGRQRSSEFPKCLLAAQFGVQKSLLLHISYGVQKSLLLHKRQQRLTHSKKVGCIMRKCKIRLFQVVMLCALLCALPVTSWGQIANSTSDETGFALLVDVSDYRDANIPPLRAKSNEVDKIKNVLHLVGGFPEQQIQVIAGENATREGIREMLTAIVEHAKTQANARFLFYLKGRSLSAQGKNYFLPHDARISAASTYIEETTLMDWFHRIPLRMKAFIQAAWNMDVKDDKDFSTQLAEILNDEGTDFDDNREVTLAEIEGKILGLGFRGDYPIRISGDRATVLIRLPSVLEVTSQPPGAIILVDGVEKGMTPARIVGLTSGTHWLHVKKELYRISEERTIDIAMARGQRLRPRPYQLKPIGIYGTTHDAEKKGVAGVEVRIGGTGYRQIANNEGKFRFEDWQAYGLLESGKRYEVLARSPDGLHTGRTFFTFNGMEDIRLDISLTRRQWIKSAEQRLRAGDRTGAMEVFDARLKAFRRGKGSPLENEQLANVPPILAPLFLDHLRGKLQAEPGSWQWHFLAARLADLIKDIPTARRHWKAVKANAPKESREYSQAIARLKEIAPSRLGWILALVAGSVVILGAVGFYLHNRRRIGEFQEIPNPYIAGKPISEQEMFFGREDIFNFIKDKFSRGTKDITIVLHGGRRTGKTSILYQIANGRLGAEFVPVFIDMQEMAGVDAHDFFRLIAQKVSDVYKTAVALSEADRPALEPFASLEDRLREGTRLDELCSRLEDKSISAYRSFNDFLTHAASTLEGKYLIFLIDEYEILERKVSEGDLTAEIFTYLRHLMQNLDNLAFIFSGSRDFAQRQRKEWAFMFNMAQPKEVTFLGEKDAIALITEPVRDFVRYDRKAVNRISRLTAGQPFFIQVICLHIIEYLNDNQQNRVTVEDVEEACHDIVENTPYHFAYLWSELTADEKIIIALLAEALTDEMAYASADDISSILPHYDLQYSRPDISKSLARLREEHLIENKVETEAYRFRMDLTRAWVQAEHPTWGVLKEVQDNHE